MQNGWRLNAGIAPYAGHLVYMKPTQRTKETIAYDSSRSFYTIRGCSDHGAAHTGRTADRFFTIPVLS